MRARQTFATVALCLALCAAPACGSDVVGSNEERATLGGAGAQRSSDACALRVTEAMVWPLGSEETPWFELHQAAAAACGLAGSIALLATEFGEPLERVHLPSEVPADGIVLVRSLLAQRRRSPLPPSGQLVIRRGAHKLVQWSWGAATPAGMPERGRALALEPWDGNGDGDEKQAWCTVAATPYDGANMGSPCLRNPGCTTCRNSATGRVRRRRPPGPGELSLVQLDVKFNGRNAGRQRITLRSHSNEAIDVEGIELRIAPIGRRERRWKLLAPSCAAIGAHASVSIAVGAAPGPRAGRWLFAGPTLPECDALATLALGEVVLDEAVVPRAQRERATLPLRDDDAQL